MGATGAKKSYKGYICNSSGTAHFFATGTDICLCGAMEVDSLVKRSRTMPPGAVKMSKKCESKRASRGL